MNIPLKKPIFHTMSLTVINKGYFVKPLRAIFMRATSVQKMTARNCIKTQYLVILILIPVGLNVINRF